MGLAARERAALADFLFQAGPDQPTLCEGWSTGDLLAHLLVRERRPDGAVGIVLPALAGYSQRVKAELSAHPWAQQLRWFRGGPPWWNPIGWGPLDELANGAEMFIHHEDARRGRAGWTPRALDRPTAQAVVALLASAMMRYRLRRSRVGITAVLPDGTALVLHPGSPVAQLHGEPAEVLLWLAGRRAVRLSLQGDPDAVRAAEALPRGM